MIKTIIFDFGDVFINLDKPATERELLKLGLPKITDEMYQYAFQYEKGLISTEDFTAYYCELFPEISKLALENAWNAIILDFPDHRLKFIESLSSSKTYQLILLSNTNELHIKKVIKNMGIDRYKRFQNCFDKFYLSHEIHCRKPDSEIYKYVIEKNNLVAQECLFIDDTIENTVAASSIGLYSWNNNPATEDVVNLFTIKKELF